VWARPGTGRDRGRRAPGRAARTVPGIALMAGEVEAVSVPLYQAKAEFFRTLAHPVRIRVLELLCEGPKPVRDLLAEIEIEASSLSQQLAVLRRYGIVTATREGSTVVYALAGADVSELMLAARRILTDLLTDRRELLAELQESTAR